MNRNLIILLAALALVGYGVKQRFSASGPGTSVAAGGRISTISEGERVDVAAHAQPKGRTIIDFGAPW